MPRYYRMKVPKRLSQREIHNAMSFMGGGVEMIAPRKTGPQPEGSVNKEIAKWRALKPGVVLERNKRRLATPVGYDKPIMLGWLVDGSSDWVGHESVVITADMVGKRVAVATYIEAKSDEGVVSDVQETFLNNARDAGAIVGVATCFEDCDLIRQVWRERYVKR